MSLLAPLYLAGLAALSLPILFHLIRRAPSGRMPFGSVMFLKPSPPRFVRRKRLDNLVLLLLRGLALALLAAAFARPYLRTESPTEDDTESAPRVAVLVDTSASMRRPGLWPDALREAESALAAAAPDAIVTLHTFDRDSKTRADVAEAEGLDRSEWHAELRRRIAGLEPSWGGTDLGRALADVADRLHGSTRGTDARSTIVVISDLQEGSDLSILDSYDWPGGIDVRIRPVRTTEGNASLGPVPPEPDLVDSDARVRVRVSNDTGSEVERFTLRWESVDAEGADEVQVFCAAGDTRVVRAPERPADPAFDRLVLRGDGAPFDNVLHDREPIVHPVEVLFHGTTDAGLAPFLEHLFGGRAEYSFRVAEDTDSGLDPADTPLVVLELDGTAEPAIAGLLPYVERGGVVLAILVGSDRAASRGLLGADVEVTEAEVTRGHTLIGEVDFQHALFAPFADPRYGDFTKIRFWRHRRIELQPSDELRVLASFDDGSPFLVERTLGDGRAIVASSGWESRDSDLARSTKFAPLLFGMLRIGGRSAPPLGTYRVGDRIPVARRAAPETRRVRRPDGEWIALEADAEWFEDTAVPGHYDVEIDGRRGTFTVQLDPTESRTDPLDVQRLTRHGVPIAADTEGTPVADTGRQEKVHELEGRQKLWRWLIVGALGVLLLETAWAGRLARRSALQA